MLLPWPLAGCLLLGSTSRQRSLLARPFHRTSPLVRHMTQDEADAVMEEGGGGGVAGMQHAVRVHPLYPKLLEVLCWCKQV